MSDLFCCLGTRKRSLAPAVNDGDGDGDGGCKSYLQLCHIKKIKKEEEEVPKSYSNTKTNKEPHSETDYS